MSYGKSVKQIGKPKLFINILKPRNLFRSYFMDDKFLTILHVQYRGYWLPWSCQDHIDQLARNNPDTVDTTSRYKISINDRWVLPTVWRGREKILSPATNWALILTLMW